MTTTAPDLSRPYITVLNELCMELTGHQACYAHVWGEVVSQVRPTTAWPPRCVMFFDAGNRKGIWFTYKIGRYFPISFIFATDPRAADAEGEWQQFIFDVRELPFRFLSHLTTLRHGGIAPAGTTDFRAFHVKQLRQTRRAIQRALLEDFDFNAHIASVEQQRRQRAQQQASHLAGATPAQDDDIEQAF